MSNFKVIPKPHNFDNTSVLFVQMLDAKTFDLIMFQLVGRAVSMDPAQLTEDGITMDSGLGTFCMTYSVSLVIPVGLAHAAVRY